jgi:hypothetical protein
MTVSPRRISTRGRCGRLCRHAATASTNDAALYPLPVTSSSTSKAVPISPGPGTPPRTPTTTDRRTTGSARNQPCSERNSPAPSPTCSSNRTPASPDPYAHPPTMHNRSGNPLQHNTTPACQTKDP